jgi:ABC-type transporter Mla subunit MlaD
MDNDKAQADTLQRTAEQLLAAVEEQGRQIGELATHVGLLVQSVAQLLGEETGQPVDDEQEPQRTDLDGNPY